jgi:hypothetical protein
MSSQSVSVVPSWEIFCFRHNNWIGGVARLPIFSIDFFQGFEIIFPKISQKMPLIDYRYSMPVFDTLRKGCISPNIALNTLLRVWLVSYSERGREIVSRGCLRRDVLTAAECINHFMTVITTQDSISFVYLWYFECLIPRESTGTTKRIKRPFFPNGNFTLWGNKLSEYKKKRSVGDSFLFLTADCLYKKMFPFCSEVPVH